MEEAAVGDYAHAIRGRHGSTGRRRQLQLNDLPQLARLPLRRLC